eukprot:TRINITY_DN4270_c0_g4_i1.p2 TRINITY_DN4270_c0_g4~~TRINITY_DN4270_c0_g4_i1.p2  ORF type:complete len:184 (+),score=12.71 TRINITY_DN4270_c0_g4_i1:244-795(+)
MILITEYSLGQLTYLQNIFLLFGDRMKKKRVLYRYNMFLKAIPDMFTPFYIICFVCFILATFLSERVDFSRYPRIQRRGAQNRWKIKINWNLLFSFCVTNLPGCIRILFDFILDRKNSLFIKLFGLREFVFLEIKLSWLFWVSWESIFGLSTDSEVDMGEYGIIFDGRTVRQLNNVNSLFFYA